MHSHAGHFGGEEEDDDSPFLQSLYSSSGGFPGTSLPGAHVYGRSSASVESLVDGLIAETLDASLTQRVWSEAYPANETTILSVPYQDAMARPQDAFEDAIDNSDMPFIPKLRRKPNCIEPLNHQELMSAPWLSPYRAEIMQCRYQEWQLGRPEVIREIRGLNSCNLYFVSQSYQLNDMLQALQAPSVREIAVDCEHHAYRSYQGFLCLMQISTRDADYIVDVLALRSHLHVLSGVFTNPHVVKVLHGADKDIIWLQRDLGLYVVNMFDTGQAARELGYPSYSYSFLLGRFAGIQANKAFQTADWRQRPLPREMIDYARQDTHFLLDIYDRMRCELLDRSPTHVEIVLQRSATVCAQAYVKDHVDRESITSLILHLSRKYRVMLQCSKQRDAFAALVYWRDRVARIRDESVQYVMDDVLLLILARDCPVTLAALQRSLRIVTASIPPLLYALRGSLFWEIASVLDPQQGAASPPSVSLPAPQSRTPPPPGEKPIGFGWFGGPPGRP